MTGEGDDDWAADRRAAQDRDYGEEGIAMILALEVEGAPEPGLGAALRRAAGPLARLGATAPAEVLEIVALRELRRGREAP